MGGFRGFGGFCVVAQRYKPRSDGGEGERYEDGASQGVGHWAVCVGSSVSRPILHVVLRRIFVWGVGWGLLLKAVRQERVTKTLICERAFILEDADCIRACELFDTIDACFRIADGRL